MEKLEVLEICNNGNTIYLTDGNGNGTRIYGPKVWGIIKPQVKLKLTPELVDALLLALGVFEGNS